MGHTTFDTRTIEELRRLLLHGFRDDDRAFRRFVQDLPGGDALSVLLPGSASPMKELVDGALEAMSRIWETLDPALFDVLAIHRAQHREQLERWRAYFCPDPEGGYGVFLVHHGEARYWHLCAELERVLSLTSSEAMRLVESTPAAIAGGRSEGRALALGRAIEATGAVASFHSPPTGRCLPHVARSRAGATLALVPPRGGPDAFWLSTTPVTQALFEAVMGENPSAKRGDALPVHGVTRTEAATFCERLSDREGLTGARYRLPSESEWERAARADDGTLYPGSIDWPAVAWAVSETGPARVRALASNGWGLHDMAGNVWEWVADGDRADPTVGILKGGCFASPASDLVPAARRRAPRSERHPGHGLRVARSAATGDDATSVMGSRR
ncbi:MAG: SUMF1/EgtB/PvdO family nonheme iron enzyme [Minicystis sp.]